MSFFNKFPKIDYDINLDGITQKLIDFSRVVDVNDILAIDSTAYIKYDIIDGARPDIVSQLLYDTPDYYWTFFILNDHLKSGYHKWPKGAVALEKYIDEKYKNYVILTIPTKRSYINDKYAGFGNFPLNQFVSIKNRNNVNERAYFKYWDTNTYQAVFEKISESDFASSNLNLSYPEFVNPYNVFSAEYARAEAVRTAWNKSVYNYHVEAPGGDPILFQWRNNYKPDGLLEGTNQWYSSFADYLKTIQWGDFINDTPQFTNPKLAPRYYTNTNGMQISAFEAFYPNDNITFSPSSFNTGDYITNYAAEVANNDTLSQIKVIRPDRVAEFSSRFKELINE